MGGVLGTYTYYRGGRCELNGWLVVSNVWGFAAVRQSGLLIMTPVIFAGNHVSSGLIVIGPAMELAYNKRVYACLSIEPAIASAVSHGLVVAFDSCMIGPMSDGVIVRGVYSQSLIRDKPTQTKQADGHKHDEKSTTHDEHSKAIEPPFSVETWSVEYGQSSLVHQARSTAVHHQSSKNHLQINSHDVDLVSSSDENSQGYLSKHSLYLNFDQWPGLINQMTKKLAKV